MTKSSYQQIPFDFKASIGIENWDKDYFSVIDEVQFFNFYSSQNRRIRDYIEKLDNDEKRDNFLLSLPLVRARLNGLILGALAIQESEKKRVDLISTFPEINFFKTGDTRYLDQKTSQQLLEKPLKTYFLRRIIRTISWTRPWNLLLTIIKPQVIALGHNEVLQQHAKQSSKRVYFYQVGVLIKKINQKVQDCEYDFPYLSQLCDEIYEVLVGNLDDILGSKYLKRFNQVSKEFIQQSLFRDAKALNKCAQYKDLPQNVWVGTGASYDFRLISLAVLRKNGSATGHAHAIATLSRDYDYFYSGEFAPFNYYIDVSLGIKDLLIKNLPKNLTLSVQKKIIISALDKNEHLQKYQKNYLKNNPISKAINKKEKPTVIYVSTAITGQLGVVGAVLNGMGYLKYQIHLTNLLDKMNINLICQPHPEGVFKDQNLIHPLIKKYGGSKDRFEDVMNQADIFLFDYVHSTTFYKVLIGNKPIVRITWNDDNPCYGVADRIRNELDNRCRTIYTHLDEKGLPVIKEKVLEQYLTNNWREQVDSSYFQKLMVG